MIQQLYIDGVLADISESTSITLRHESNILTGAASFTANHSLTVSLPATIHNRKIFGLPSVVQTEVGEAYRWHDVDYIRDGIPVISGGRCRLMKATAEKIDLTMIWGMKRAIDAVVKGDMKLSDITTNASLEFHETPQLTPYTQAMSSSTEVFYAEFDTIRYMSELEYYHMHVSFQNRSWDTNSLMGASSYLHPSVRMDWLLGKIEEQNGITFDFDDPFGEISTMIVPLISKIPNDITFNGGYSAHASDPTIWGDHTGNFIRFETTNASAIISPQQNPPETQLRCAQSFKGLLRFSIYMYIDELVSMGYPIFRSKYGYRLDVTSQGRTEACIIIPENTTFMANERDANGRIGYTIRGSLPIEMDAGQLLTMRLTCISGGVASDSLYGGIHVYGGTVWVNDIIGDINEVQPTQQYPVEGNLPEIKVIDLIKFLCAVTGAFPVQSSTNDVLMFRQVEDVFNWARAEDWSSRLLSKHDPHDAEETGYTPSGWAQQNWWRWKQDDTVAGDYDGGITVDDATVEESRDVMTFPFAATDGNNIPMYTTEYKYNSDTQTWSRDIKWHKVEPRVLHIQKDDNDNAEAYFGFDMSQVIGQYYYDLVATMEHPVTIKETVMMTDLQFMSLDETKPIFLAQHGAYFALLSCELSQDGTAQVELLKLKKAEEIVNAE